MLPSPGATSWTVSSRVTVRGDPAVHRVLLTADPWCCAWKVPSGGAGKPAGRSVCLVDATRRPVSCYGAWHQVRRRAGAALPERARDAERRRCSTRSPSISASGHSSQSTPALDLTYRIVVGVLGAAIVVLGHHPDPAARPWLADRLRRSGPAGHRVRLGRAAAGLRPGQGAWLDPVGHPPVAARPRPDRARAACSSWRRDLGVRRRRRACRPGCPCCDRHRVRFRLVPAACRAGRRTISSVG